MPLLENVVVFDEPAQHNLPWAAGFPRAGCSRGQAIAGAGHVCRLRGFVLGKVGRNGREGGHRCLQECGNKLGIWLSTAQSPGQAKLGWALHPLQQHMGGCWRSATHLAVSSGLLHALGLFAWLGCGM